MDAVSAALIGKALDGLALRQVMSAQNIANANTPGYQAVGVSFEDALQSAAPLGMGAISRVSPQTQILPQSDLSGEMRLDLELAKASQTAMRYSALIDVMSRQMAMTRSAVIPGGR